MFYMYCYLAMRTPFYMHSIAVHIASLTLAFFPLDPAAPF